MRRYLPLLAALLAASCVTVEPPPDPRGSVKPGQRMIVLVTQSPGPWIVADPDSKAETAMKLLPIGNFLQGMQEDRINELSKEIQPYLPRPRYDAAVEAALVSALKQAHGGQVQTWSEAGITPSQRRDWNAASDQLDWRRKYYFVDDKPSPRDFPKLLSLDDAVIVDVNVSYGLEPNEEETPRTVPVLSAAARLHRGDTARLMWGKEVRLGDNTSSSTLTEFRAVPSELTDRLYAMAAPLGARVAAELAREAGLLPAPAPILSESVPQATFQNGVPAGVEVSTSPMQAPAPAPEPAAAPAPDPASVPAVSTEPVTATPPAPTAP
jgi:hypothetical protein